MTGASDEHILVSRERDGAVRRVVIDRPDKRNALTGSMFAALVEQFSATPDPEERVIVLSSIGEVFSAGVDLTDKGDRPAGAPNPLVELCLAIAACPVPVVVVVQGAAIAGGLMIALHADFVIASEEAKLGNVAVQLGMAPPRVLTRRLVEATGPAFGREILMLGDLIPARRYLQAGAISAVVPAGELESAAAAVTDRLARNAPLSLRAVKATINHGMLFAEGADLDALVDRAASSEDAKEGVLARRERREPAFTGR